MLCRGRFDRACTLWIKLGAIELKKKVRKKIGMGRRRREEENNGEDRISLRDNHLASEDGCFVEEGLKEFAQFRSILERLNRSNLREKLGMGRRGRGEDIQKKEARGLCFSRALTACDLEIPRAD